MPTSETDTILLNRILEEIRGLRGDIRTVETEQGDVKGRVIKLEEDKIVRDKAAASRTAYVCAFGGVLIAAMAGLFSMVYDNKTKVESINAFGTAYGRGKEDTFLRRFEDIEKRLPTLPTRTP